MAKKKSANVPDPKDVDAIFAWLDAPDHGRAEFDKLIEWVLSEKRKYLPEEKLSQDENTIFEAELERLEAVVSYLNKLISKYDDPTLQASFYDVAIGAFVAGINIGQYSEPISLTKKELNAERQRINSIKANKAKADLAEIKWRKTALRLAEMALQAGKRSQNDIAAYIMANWREYIRTNIQHQNSDKKCPKYSTLVTAISNWQREGKLQK